MDAVAALNAIDDADPEEAHSKADDILLEVVPPDVRDAYVTLQERCGWWAFA